MSAERGRQKPRAEMSVAVLEHIEKRGGLQGFRLLVRKSSHS